MSGIYIKGMEMPDGCEDCRLRHRHQGFTATDYCQLFARIVDPWTFGRSMNGERPGWCPLVPVPDHGRLIDADALMRQVERDTPLSAVFEKTIRRYLNSAPTIIPAEEEAEP